MSASEVARNFSSVLDSAERGETIVITRAGRRVAAISPASRSNGVALREVFERWHQNPALDEVLADRVAAVREASTAELDADPWRG
ncbi:MAG TPA: type II toxin-antitoxin system prevent-host-death family antitoxin [Solirubrobacteraceae bacterium]|nr:type II toxin-antitoxin system prevent-host-death family antitoxin [Solirubrobacteraceae bacterium]